MVTSPRNGQTAAERRSAEARVKGVVTKYASAHQRLVATARRSLRKRLPTAYELVYEYRGWFVISFSPNDKGYAGILAIRGDAGGVKLYFSGAKWLADPENLLKGTAQVRWIELDRASTLDRPEVARLIDATIARNRVLFPKTGRGPIVIRSAARQRADLQVTK